MSASLLQPLIYRITNYDSATSLGSRLRYKRATALVELARVRQRRTGSVTILDVGGTGAYWRNLMTPLLANGRCDIHVVNTYPQQADHASITCSVGDGRELGFDDHQFDIVHANSVIEHVGRWQDMEAFASEIRRLAPAYFVQTPNFFFPVEPHYGLPFVHWLAPQTRAALLQMFPLGRFNRASDPAEAMRVIEDSVLLTRGQLQTLFPDADIVSERFAGLAKSFTAIRGN